MSRRYPGGFLTVSYNGLSVPNAPIIGTASNANAQSLVTFTPPANVGGGAITGYQAIATNVANGSRVLATGSSSPILVTGLTNYVTYSIAVAATNIFGTGKASAGATANPYLPNPPTSVEYLVVGGGGGGGLNGGGGAGGVRTGSVSVTAGSAINAIAGAGGAGGFAINFGGKTGIVYTEAVSGTGSFFGGISANGGGRGGRWINGVNAGTAGLMNGNAGGSGGGAGGYSSYFVQPVGKTPGFTVIVNLGGNGTGGQGNNGGNGIQSGSFGASLGGGGGGAGSSGTSPTGSPLSPGDGGNGVSSSITGAAVTYGGGGGGGFGYPTNSGLTILQSDSGVGGSGGGGGGGYYVPPFFIGKTYVQPNWVLGTNGTFATGGGGGGGVQGNNMSNNSRNGGTGGSGIVVIRYPDTFDAAVSVSGATVTVSGGYRIYTWFYSGQITF